MDKRYSDFKKIIEILNHLELMKLCITNFAWYVNKLHLLQPKVNDNCDLPGYLF